MSTKIGGLWGFVGMIVGVPLFAVIYDVIKKLVIHGLQFCLACLLILFYIRQKIS